jgi:arylformamidase
MLSLIFALITSNLLAAPEAPDAPDAPDAPQEQTVTKDIVYAQRAWTRDGLTSLDVYTPKAETGTEEDAARPVVIFIHGGGWSIGDKSRVQLKPEWALRNNWVLVSVNYRLSPRVQHPAHAQDVAEAIAYIKENASSWGADPEQLALIGHSAGAHLAAIVASEESLLDEHAMSPTDLDAVVLLDGAGYHIPNQLKSQSLGAGARKMYEAAFGPEPQPIEGSEESTWTLASPTLQARPDDKLPALLAVHAGDRLRSKLESKQLIDAWTRTGAPGITYHARDKDHGSVNKELGTQGDADTLAVEVFLRNAFEQE